MQPPNRSTRSQRQKQQKDDQPNLGAQCAPDHRDQPEHPRLRARGGKQLSADSISKLEAWFWSNTKPVRNQQREMATALGVSQKKVMGWVKERQAMLAHETATTLGLPLDRPPPQRARTGTVSPPKSSLKQVSSPSRNSTLTLGHMTPVVTRRKPFANLSNGDGPRLTRASAAQKKSLVFTATASLPDPSPGAPKIHTRSEGPGSIPPSELYRQLPSSSPTRPENTRDFAQPPILKFSATSGYSDVDRKRKTLDWACQEQQKRRRIRGIQLHEGRHHGPAATNLELLSLVATSEDIFRCIRPTDEHTASEDVISGSISLLAFKHSRRLPRRDAWR